MVRKNSRLTLTTILRLGAIALILGQIVLTVWIIGSPVSGLPASTAAIPAQTIAAGIGYSYNDDAFPVPVIALNEGDSWLEVINMLVQLALFQSLVYGYDARILALALVLGLLGLSMLAWTQRDPHNLSKRWQIEEEKP